MNPETPNVKSSNAKCLMRRVFQVFVASTHSHTPSALWMFTCACNFLPFAELLTLHELYPLSMYSADIQTTISEPWSYLPMCMPFLLPKSLGKAAIFSYLLHSRCTKFSYLGFYWVPSYMLIIYPKSSFSLTSIFKIKLITYF